MNTLGFVIDEEMDDRSKIKLKTIKKEGLVEYDVLESHNAAYFLTARPRIETFIMKIPDEINLHGEWFPYWFEFRGHEYILEDSGEIIVEMPILSDEVRNKALEELEFLCETMFKN